MAAAKGRGNGSGTATKKANSGSRASGKSTSGRSTSSRSTSGRSTSGRNTSSKTATRQRAEDISAMDEEVYRLPPERKREIYLFIFFAINLVLILGTYGVCGKVGKAVSGFFFGIFGATFYVLPVFFCVAACLIVANMDRPGSLRKAIIKILWVFAAFMVLGFIFQLSAGLVDNTVKTLYMNGYSNHKGGGIVFGGLISLIGRLVGKVGAIIFTVLITIITIIEVTEKSIIHMLKGFFTFSYDEIAKERQKHRRDDDYDEEDDDDDDFYGYGRTGVYDSYDIDDDELDRIDRQARKQRKQLQREAAARSRFDDQKVFPSEPEEKPKKKKGNKRNKTVREEEMRELVPGGTTDEHPIALPGEQSQVMRSEETGRSSNTGRKNAAKVDEGPMDFFDIEPDAETYADPFGSDTVYDARNSSVIKQELPPMDDESIRNTRTATDSIYSRGVQSSRSDRMRDAAQFSAEEMSDVTQSSADRMRNVSQSSDEKIRKVSQVVAERSRRQQESVNKPSYETEEIMPMEVEEDEFIPENETVTKDDKIKATDEVKSEIAKKTDGKTRKKYIFPPMKLLKSGGTAAYFKNDGSVRETAKRLKETLASFGVNVTITDYSCGPTVTRYELQPEQGVKVSRILSLADDIKLNLAAADIRIEAPIPGKAAIGIEVPNKDNQMVYFRDLIDNDSFKKFKSNVAFAVGKDIGGQIVISDIAKMPHLLIAGAPGSGKSVCINTIIMSILYKATPEDVRMIMIDPKMVELAAYNGIPHLLIPVVTDPKKAAGALNWAVEEMTKRYQLFAKYGVRNIQGFNAKVEEAEESGTENEDPSFTHMPLIVVIVDELADLMMVAHGEVEDSIVRLTQLARAAGIHLVIATQRPSVDVITGLIKANVPSRIAFAVSSGTDSRTILDIVGAEKLLGKGDMLFYPTGSTKPARVQGAFISDEEVASVTSFIKEHFGDSEYDTEIAESINSASASAAGGSGGGDSEAERYDELFEDAGRMVIEKDKASIGYLQRMFRIGFNRAARIMDQLAEAGVVGPEEGTKPRKILMTIDEFEQMMSL